MAIDWKTRHVQAMQATQISTSPLSGRRAEHEKALVALYKGWRMYAEAHEKRFESKIGEDYVLGPEWQKIGEALRRLLNGETGNLDCGTVDSSILDTMKANGIDTENL